MAPTTSNEKCCSGISHASVKCALVGKRCGPKHPGTNPPTPPPGPSFDPEWVNRTIDAGYIVTQIPYDPEMPLSFDDCRSKCVDQYDAENLTELGSGYCEAWSMRNGVCSLHQLSGEGAGDDKAWKMHSNFRGDCTPLWVDIAPKNTLSTMNNSEFHTQQGRDLACCQACSDSPDCESWTQATMWDDANPTDSYNCYLRRVTTTDVESVAAVIGTGDSVADFNDKEPKAFFPERRNIVCSDVQERRSCGGGSATRSECESFGCCWETTGQCFTSTWRPVVIMHGMGAVPHHHEKNVLWLRNAFPGIYVKVLNIYPGFVSETTGMSEQMHRINQAIQVDPMLEDGFNFYGESQGALEARVWTQEYGSPAVHNLVALSGPQAGEGECPRIDSHVQTVCADAAATLKIWNWPRCSFCDYWKTLSKETYLKNSNWLADINNDRESKEEYKSQNMRKLNLYMTSVGTGDEVIKPKESAWHTFWYWEGNRSVVEDPVQTESYLGDWLGLRTLDEQGKWIRNVYDGGHCGYNESWWRASVQPVLGNKFPPAVSDVSV